MDTAPLDIVYFVKDGTKNEELRYSIRSVCQNMPFNRIWIFGGCPQNIVPDVRVRVAQTGKTKWDRVRNMYKMVCENKEITDNFIMFNDDFFVMKPTDHLEPLYRCTLSEHIKILEPIRPTPYSRLLRDCRETLTGEPLSYELHVPFIFNKNKLLSMLEAFPMQHCARTMYGNMYNIGGKRSNDVKIFSVNPGFDYKNSRFLSTDDPIVNINNDVWRWLTKQLTKKSRFEI
jgi:hypothetical protein